jgi:hypothetical protein
VRLCGINARPSGTRARSTNRSVRPRTFLHDIIRFSRPFKVINPSRMRKRLRVGGKNCSIHRLLYSCAIKRALSKDECLLPLCESPGCIEPRHFRLVARRDLCRHNARRSIRLPRKLSEAPVREIRRTPRSSAWHTAKQYGVSRALVRSIIDGTRRRSVSASSL